MNRKLKRAMTIADHWMALEVGWRFVNRRRAGFEILRETEDYTVAISDPEMGARQPRIEIVAEDVFLESLSEADQAAIARNEIMLFKTFMVLKAMDDEQLRLDKKSRDRFHAYMQGK